MEEKEEGFTDGIILRVVICIAIIVTFILGFAAGADSEKDAIQQSTNAPNDCQEGLVKLNALARKFDLAYQTCNAELVCVKKGLTFSSVSSNGIKLGLCYNNGEFTNVSGLDG